MIKTVGTFALALAAFLFAISAPAVSLNPKGLGQVLIYPYYTVNKNQDTLISVGNASDTSKIMQVRFLEGYNGRDALQSFWLFLSPRDVWTASISQTADDGGAILRTTDKSCTWPAIPANGLLFNTSSFDGTGPVAADSGPQGITRTREGSIHFINGADIIPASPTDVRITHVQDGAPEGGVPPGCAELSGTNVLQDEIPPSNQLYGSAAIVNVSEGTFFAYNPDAIAGFTDVPIVNYQFGLGPTLQDANSDEATTGNARAYVFDNNGRPLVLDYEFGVDAVSAIFMSDALYNEYLVDASLGSNTDWIVTFPTKAFYTDDLYTIVPPFFPPFDAEFRDGVAPVFIAGAVYDREEGSTQLGPDCDLCPPPLPPAELNYEVNVVSFLNLPAPTSGTPSGVFGSTLTSLNITPYSSSGAVTLDLVSASSNHQLRSGIDPQGNEVILRGLPVTGFMSYNIINTQAQPGMLANYGGSFHHRATMSCAGPADECDATNSGATGSR